MNSINDCVSYLSFKGSFLEAVNAEKCFSDFFNTTDAEAEMAAMASEKSSVSAPKRLRKIKRPRKFVTDESESDDEGRFTCNGNDVQSLLSFNAFSNVSHQVEMISTKLLLFSATTHTSRTQQQTTIRR